MSVIKAGVFGASGYAGQELIALLQQHPHFSVEFAVSASFAGQSVNGNGLVYLHQEQADMGAVDMVFLCTPHGASATLAAQALEAGAKVVDLSADLRLKSAEAYQHWYQHPHAVPALLPTAYGLPEFNRQQINSQAQVIANPGCYPTSTLLALLPLANAGVLLPGAPIVIDAKSGVSGAGRNPKADTHFVEVFGDLKPYNIGRLHRHTGEIEQELQAADPAAGTIVFSPHLLPIDRGLLSTIYVPVNASYGAVYEIMAEQYANEPLVELLPSGQTARLRDAVRTNKAVISVASATAQMVVIVSAIDNLRKGASSQAVQNANLMFDLPETSGLLER